MLLDFIKSETGNLKRNNWTLKLTRAFFAQLKTKTFSTGRPIRTERTVNRIIAHLKTFSKWINSIQPFILFDPMLKYKISDTIKNLNVDNALTEPEKIKIIGIADNLIFTDALSRDLNRYNDKDKPQLKYKRPFRDRAIIYTLIETGMRRIDLINISIEKVNFKTMNIYIKNKHTRKYPISKKGMRAIRDYIKKERGLDFEKWQSSILFLPPNTVSKSNGKLTPCVINNIWNRVCKAAGISGKTPHSCRHAMGKFIMKKTGNPAAVKKQLAHINPAYSFQYASTDET